MTDNGSVTGNRSSTGDCGGLPDPLTKASGCDAESSLDWLRASHTRWSIDPEDYGCSGVCQLKSRRHCMTGRRSCDDRQTFLRGHVSVPP